MCLFFVATDNDSEWSRGQESAVGEAGGNGLKRCRLPQSDELPGILAAGRGGCHCGFEECFNVFFDDWFLAECADATA